MIWQLARLGDLHPDEQQNSTLPSPSVYAGIVLTRQINERTTACGEIRELADRQAQAAANFREAIRHSLAIDTGGADDGAATISSHPSSHGDNVRDTSAEAGGALGGRAVGEEPSKYPGEGPYRRLGDGNPSMAEEERNRDHKVDRGEKNVDEDADLPDGELLRSAADAADASDTDPSDTGNVTTGGAASMLASDVCRLASRQDEAADELLRASPSEPARWTAVPAVVEAVVALGKAVGLQAKAVGLMEEVVERTKHSRVSGDARKIICWKK